MPFDVTDLARRPFEKITGFQYAVWALDSPMWTMILKYLPNEIAAEQIQSMKTGLWVSQHGDSVSWQNLIDALGEYSHLLEAPKLDKAVTDWVKKVNHAQAVLPVHVINEYCRPDRSFEPCPDFNSTVPFPHTRNVDKGEWDTVGNRSWIHGWWADPIAYFRHNYPKAKSEKIDDVYVDFYSGGYLANAVETDLKAIKALLEIRVRQRDQLFSELSSARINLPSKAVPQ